MKALIIGGNKGFGKEISKQLLKNGYEIITVGRSLSSYKNYLHYSCNVGNPDSWLETLRKIQKEHKKIDLLACIVGFAKAKPFKNLTYKDWEETFCKNFIYAALAIQKLIKLLYASTDPKIIIIGSRWSYKIGVDELTPYIIAKHALRILTKNIAQTNAKIKINCYCVPPMNTPGYKIVNKSFQRLKNASAIKNFIPKKLAEPKLVAKSLINKVLKTNASGSTFIIKYNGQIRKYD